MGGSILRQPGLKLTGLISRARPQARLVKNSVAARAVKSLNDGERRSRSGAVFLANHHLRNGGNVTPEMGVIDETDIYPMIRRLLRFPFPQICRHFMALNLLSLLEQKGMVISVALAKAIMEGDDETALIELEKLEKIP